MSFVTTGAKPVSDDLYRKVADALFTELDRLHKKAADKIGLMAGKMISELEE